jgi:hypothetical protein
MFLCRIVLLLEPWLPAFFLGWAIRQIRKRVVLVTTTFCKNTEETRFKCTVKTVLEARRCGYPIIIVDDSPDLFVTKALERVGATVIRGTNSGMGSSRREVIQYGLDTKADIIIWLEPEKYPIVRLLWVCVLKFIKEKMYLLIPRRRNLNSYPDYQHWSELRANHELANITGRADLDLMIGPRIYSKMAAKAAMTYKGVLWQFMKGAESYGDNWEILFIPVLWALQSEHKVGSCLVDYIHPPEQTAEDENNLEMDKKRDKQRDVLINTMAKEAARIRYKKSLS